MRRAGGAAAPGGDDAPAFCGRRRNGSRHSPGSTPGIPLRPRSNRDTIYGMVTASLDTASYAEIARRPLEAERCVLLVIDIQQKLLPPILHKDRLLKNSELLIRLANILKIPTLVTTQYQKGLGATVPEIAATVPATRRTAPRKEIPKTRKRSGARHSPRPAVPSRSRGLVVEERLGGEQDAGQRGEAGAARPGQA